MATYCERLECDPYYIEKIPKVLLTPQMCRVAVEAAAGDCDFFSMFKKKFPEFVNEALCKIAVDAKPKSIDTGIIDEERDIFVHQYSDPVIKYVPKNFRTAEVVRTSLKHDWRTFCFVPKEIQVSNPDLCEQALDWTHFTGIMSDADDLFGDTYKGELKREKKF